MHLFLLVALFATFSPRQNFRRRCDRQRSSRLAFLTATRVPKAIRKEELISLDFLPLDSAGAGIQII